MKKKNFNMITKECNLLKMLLLRKRKEDDFILNAGNSSQAKYINFQLNNYVVPI